MFLHRFLKPIHDDGEAFVRQALVEKIHSILRCCFVSSQSRHSRETFVFAFPRLEVWGSDDCEIKLRCLTQETGFVECWRHGDYLSFRLSIFYVFVGALVKACSHTRCYRSWIAWQMPLSFHSGHPLSKNAFVLCCCCCCGAGRLTLSVLPHALYRPIYETVGSFPNLKIFRGRNFSLGFLRFSWSDCRLHHVGNFWTPTISNVRRNRNERRFLG